MPDPPRGSVSIHRPRAAAEREPWAAAEDPAGCAAVSAAKEGGREQGDMPNALFNFLSHQNKGPVTSCAASHDLI